MKKKNVIQTIVLVGTTSFLTMGCVSGQPVKTAYASVLSDCNVITNEYVKSEVETSKIYKDTSGLQELPEHHIKQIVNSFNQKYNSFNNISFKVKEDFNQYKKNGLHTEYDRIYEYDLDFTNSKYSKKTTNISNGIAVVDHQYTEKVGDSFDGYMFLNFSVYNPERKDVWAKIKNADNPQLNNKVYISDDMIINGYKTPEGYVLLLKITRKDNCVYENMIGDSLFTFDNNYNLLGIYSHAGRDFTFNDEEYAEQVLIELSDLTINSNINVDLPEEARKQAKEMTAEELFGLIFEQAMEQLDKALNKN